MISQCTALNKELSLSLQMQSSCSCYPSGKNEENCNVVIYILPSCFVLGLFTTSYCYIIENTCGVFSCVQVYHQFPSI